MLTLTTPTAHICSSAVAPRSANGTIIFFPWSKNVIQSHTESWTKIKLPANLYTNKQNKIKFGSVWVFEITCADVTHVVRLASDVTRSIGGMQCFTARPPAERDPPIH